MIPPELRDRILGIRLVIFDFDGVFTDNTVYVTQDGTEAVRCWRSDGLGLQELEKLGISALVLSTEKNPVVSQRCRKLRIECEQGCEDKKARLIQIVAERGLSIGQVAFVGNDTNDLGCLEIAGLPIVVEDAHPEVVPYASYRTRAQGGRGAVREVCDLFKLARS